MKKRILLLILSFLVALSSIQMNLAYAIDDSDTVNSVGVYQGHAYKLYSNCSSWQEAKEFCELMGGHLATITSSGENEYVFNFMKECGYTSAYFGASDSKQEGTCEWETTDIGITLGDYVQMGTYYGEPILWRCVDVDENGPLMLSDKILCIKPFDAFGVVQMVLTMEVIIAVIIVKYMVQIIGG